MKPSIGVVTTHPIQYHSHWFRALASDPRVSLEVLYCHQPTGKDQARAGFGVEFSWDVPLLDGYRYRFLRNEAASPGLESFAGVDTPELKAIIAARAYDAVIVSGWHYRSAWQAIRSAWKVGVPVMVRSDSHLHTPRSGLKKFVKELSHRAFIPKLDACLAVGKWSKEYFEHYGARVDRVFRVPHSVGPEWLSSPTERTSSDRASLLSAWHIKEDATVFLFSGKFILKKRPLDFVRAIAEARRSGVQAAGLMVGDGPLRAACEAFCHEQKVPVKFAGFLNQSEIGRAYTASDVLVLPSDGGETWGLVVNEAMSCGRPCIVSDQVGCGPDLIVPGKTGFTFPLGDIHGLASLMRHFCNSPRELASMGRNARQHVEAYSAPAAVEGVVAAVTTVLSK